MTLYSKQSAEDLVGTAYIHLEGGHTAKAIFCFNQAIALDPVEDAAWFGLGMIYQEQNRFDKAIKCYQTILEFQPTNLVTLMALGRVADCQNRLNIAQDFYEQVITINPQFILAYEALAKNYSKQGNQSYSMWCQDRVRSLRHDLRIGQRGRFVP